MAMALAMDRNGNKGAIHTCDKSNDFHIPLELVSRPINGYPKKSGHEVLNDLNSKGAKFDFLHIDGRLGPEDWELLEIMVGKDVVIAIDGFGGLYKGAQAGFDIRRREFFKDHVFIYPPSVQINSMIKVFTSADTALFMPAEQLMVKTK